jgi:formamidopyrimidine-DNA glycosylase
VPELPEVEVVRSGLERWVTGRRIAAVDVLHPRAARRHLPGPADLVAQLTGRRIEAVARRGKYLWCPLDSGAALLCHLGMSGQLLLHPPEAADPRHLRARIGFAGDPELQLRFVDQRMFGGLAVVPVTGTADGLAAGAGTTSALLPVPVTHIARDPLDPALDEPALIRRIRSRRTGIKRALLDQTLLSGVGNIYADEALWAVRLHHARATDRLSGPVLTGLLDAVRTVFRQALAEGGTSFDGLYVDVDGRAGYFDRSLAVYGRAGQTCRRCGGVVVREPFMNRSAFRCVRCPRAPRRVR